MVGVSEITGTEGHTIVMQEIFASSSAAWTRPGTWSGEFLSTGIRPKVMERIERAGIDPARLAGHWS